MPQRVSVLRNHMQHGRATAIQSLDQLRIEAKQLLEERSVSLSRCDVKRGRTATICGRGDEVGAVLQQLRDNFDVALACGDMHPSKQTR